jgi:hypothetical protein
MAVVSVAEEAWAVVREWVDRRQESELSADSVALRTLPQVAPIPGEAMLRVDLMVARMQG